MAARALFLVALSLCFLSAASRTLNMTKKMTGIDSGASDEFGSAVAISVSQVISGYKVVVGAFRAPVMANTQQGSAYVLQCYSNACISLNKLTAADGASDDYFGASVAMFENRAVVGANGADLPSRPNQGAAYIFDCPITTCTWKAKLVASDGAADDAFGSSVSISGSLVVVGAPLADLPSQTDQGAAYVFDCSSFPCTQRAKLIASDGAAGDEFGGTVAISGTLVVVGASQAQIGSNNGQGAAFVFDCSSFPCIQRAKLAASDGAASDGFGGSVSVSGTLVGAGASQAQIGSNNGQGAAYIFDCSSFPCSETAKLVASDGEAGDSFGSSISISGRRVMVGAHQDGIGSNSNQGSAYVFFCPSYPCFHTAKLVAGDGAAGDSFGRSVSISEGLLLAGARLSDLPSSENQGAAYAISLFQPLRCRKETVNGATWPETALSTTASLPCPPGYAGQLTRSCPPIGMWDAVINSTCTLNPPCPAVADYAHVAWPETPAAQIATGSCVPGYGNSPNGPPIRTCPPSGSVFSPLVSNHCIRLRCPTVEESNALWGSTFALDTCYSSCKAGLAGSPTRDCLANGTWGPISNPCFVGAAFCPAELYVRAAWPITQPGDTATGGCITGWTGSPTRICKRDGTWQDLVSNHCTRI